MSVSVDFERQVFSPREAAEFLKVSRSFIYVLFERGDLQKIKIGGHTRVAGRDLARLVESKRQPACHG